MVNIQADRNLPFRIVNRVMFSCSVAGYSRMNFATLDAGSYEATSGKAPGS